MKNISKQVLPIIRSTRKMLLPHYGKAEIAKQKDQSAHNVVTQLDYKIEQYLSDQLKKIDPNAEFVGEEFGGDRNADRFWLIDPIDGTTHFIRGLPFCTIMLALIEGGQVTFSVIYDFVGDILYHAERGNGAYKNNRPILVSNRSINQAYVGWETHLEKKENLEKYLKLREKCVLFKTVSAGYEYALIADGKMEARVCFDPYGKDYDFAAGSLLVSEAGGIVANLGKDTYDYRNVNFIASNKYVFESLTRGPNAIFPISTSIYKS